MEGKIKTMLLGLVLIIVGVSLIPIAFATIGAGNWNLTAGGTVYDLSWVGYLIGLLFAIAILGAGIWVLSKSFGK